jgi:hypothetical protein
MTFEELHLKFQSAHVEYTLSKPAHDDDWSSWYAKNMIEDDVKIPHDELASLIREADVAYQNLPEQEPYTHFIAHFIYTRS